MNNINQKKVQITHDDFKLFVGENSEYYIDKWKGFEESNKKISWNGAAFFFHLFWFAYRKMYYYVYILMALFSLRFYFQMSHELPPFAGYVIKYFEWVLLGLFGNYLYYHHTKKKIVEIKLKYEDNESQKAALQKSGGGSGVSVIVAFIAFLGVVFGPLLLLQILN